MCNIMFPEEEEVVGVGRSDSQHQPHDDGGWKAWTEKVDNASEQALSYLGLPAKLERGRPRLTVTFLDCGLPATT